MARAQFPGPQRQRGIGMVAVFALFTVAVFLGTFAMKLVPEYMENMTVQTIVQKASDNPAVRKLPKNKLYEHLNKSYRMNNLWDLKAEDTVVLKKAGRNNGYNMMVQYEKRTNFIHNIYLVTSFEQIPEGGVAIATSK